MSKPEISALPDRLKPVADKIRSKNGWVISTHFTLVEGKNGTPFISEHLRELRPFLGKEILNRVVGGTILSILLVPLI